MDVIAEGKQLIIDGQAIDLDETVADTLVLDDCVIVRLETDRTLREGDRSFNRNVLAFDRGRQQLWTIQEAPHGGEDEPKPYTAIGRGESGLTAYNWIGVTYNVDLETGQVTAVPAAGRPW